jgi:hypothetical protein
MTLAAGRPVERARDALGRPARWPAEWPAAG